MKKKGTDKSKRKRIVLVKLEDLMEIAARAYLSEYPELEQLAVIFHESLKLPFFQRITKARYITFSLFAENNKPFRFSDVKFILKTLYAEEHRFNWEWDKLVNKVLDDKAFAPYGDQRGLWIVVDNPEKRPTCGRRPKKGAVSFVEAILIAFEKRRPEDFLCARLYLSRLFETIRKKMGSDIEKFRIAMCPSEKEGVILRLADLMDCFFYFGAVFIFTTSLWLLENNILSREEIAKFPKRLHSESFGKCLIGWATMTDEEKGEARLIQQKILREHDIEMRRMFQKTMFLLKKAIASSGGL